MENILGVRTIFFLQTAIFSSSEEDDPSEPEDMDDMDEVNSAHEPTAPLPTDSPQHSTLTPTNDPTAASYDVALHNPDTVSAAKALHNLENPTHAERHFGLDAAFEEELNNLGLTCLIDRPVRVRQRPDSDAREGPSKRPKYGGPSFGSAPLDALHIPSISVGPPIEPPLAGVVVLGPRPAPVLPSASGPEEDSNTAELNIEIPAMPTLVVSSSDAGPSKRKRQEPLFASNKRGCSDLNAMNDALLFPNPDLFTELAGLPDLGNLPGISPLVTLRPQLTLLLLMIIRFCIRTMNPLLMGFQSPYLLVLLHLAILRLYLTHTGQHRMGSQPPHLYHLIALSSLTHSPTISDGDLNSIVAVAAPVQPQQHQ